MTTQNHPWSSDPVAQAAIRRAEPDTGPTLTHAEVPRAVERLAERVARLEAVMPKSASASNAEAPENKVDTMRAVCHIDTDETIDERGGVPDPLPEEAAGGGKGTGLRTERVVLEIVQNAQTYTPLSEWPWMYYLQQSLLWTGESVRVVPTPGPGLTEEERDSIKLAAKCAKVDMAYSLGQELDNILARDAAARDGGGEVARLTVEEQSAALDGARKVYRGTIQRLTAERDAAIRERDAALASVSELESAGGPVLYGVRWGGSGRIESHDVRDTDEQAARLAGGPDGTVVPLYAAPPQERVVRLPRWIARPFLAQEIAQAQLVTDALDAAGVRWEVGE